MRTCETVPQTRRKLRIAHFRLTADAICRRIITKTLPGFINAQPEHFVTETLAMATTLPSRELPDVSHLVEKQRHQRCRVVAGTDVQSQRNGVVRHAVHACRETLSISRDVRRPRAAVQRKRHWREGPAPAMLVAEVVVPVELTIDIFKFTVERREKMRISK